MSRHSRIKSRPIGRWLGWVVSLAVVAVGSYYVTQTPPSTPAAQSDTPAATTASTTTDTGNPELAINKLNELPVRDKETGDDYERSNFSSGWSSWKDCNVRQKILNRDVKNVKVAANGCTVVGGQLVDPYSGQTIDLTSKSAVSRKVQIDHVVALSNAWQTGARYLSATERKQLANDDLELIAVCSSANQDKSDGDASEWLPENKAFRCPYVARQIAVKLKYHLWVTAAEKSAMTSILNSCPNQTLPAA